MEIVNYIIELLKGHVRVRVQSENKSHMRYFNRENVITQVLEESKRKYRGNNCRKSYYS